MIHLDTHAAIWLAEANERRLSRTARRLIDRQPLVISPAVVLELEVLSEIGRLQNAPAAILARLYDHADVSPSSAVFADVVAAAATFGWTRDVFDRLIVANAMADGARLLTADQHILDNFRDAVW
ncbi:MAG: PIN domain-containing protein [Caulobacter sp.]|nr:PIN domain-containing protein [Caulobacter sp.]